MEQQIKEIPVHHLERISSHSHIKGLGLDPITLEPTEDAGLTDGIIGQEKARRAAGIVLEMLRQHAAASLSASGKAILIAGPAGTGKTALAMGLARSLMASRHGSNNTCNSNNQDASDSTPMDDSTPNGPRDGPMAIFNVMSAGEIVGDAGGLGKTELLCQAIRKSIGIRLREEVEVLEGEVVELVIDKNISIFGPIASSSSSGSSSSTGGGSLGRLTLKTTDMETFYDLGARMCQSLLRARVSVGDVVSIERLSGRVSRLGRSFARARDYDAGGAAGLRFLPCPEGEVLRRRRVCHTVSLHDIDVLNAGNSTTTLTGSGSASDDLEGLFMRGNPGMALFAGPVASGLTGIDTSVRDAVDAKVSAWRTEGKCEMLAGVLLLEEAHLLDLECYAFLNRALENDLVCPLLVLATNAMGSNGHSSSSVTATNACSIPRDFLDRMLTVQTEPYQSKHLRQIIQIRAAEEEVSLAEDGLNELVRIAGESSLRYALQLVILAGMARQRRANSNNGSNGSKTVESLAVERVDVERVERLFLDERRSIQGM